MVYKKSLYQDGDGTYTEGRLQSDCFLEFWNKYPILRMRLFMVKNNSKNRIQGARDKAMGMVKGAADMIFLKSDGKNLFLEFKLPGETQKKHQKKFQKMVESLGHEYRLVYTREEFWKHINLEKNT